VRIQNSGVRNRKGKEMVGETTKEKDGDSYIERTITDLEQELITCQRRVTETQTSIKVLRAMLPEPVAMGPTSDIAPGSITVDGPPVTDLPSPAEAALKEVWDKAEANGWPEPSAKPSSRRGRGPTPASSYKGVHRRKTKNGKVGSFLATLYRGGKIVRLGTYKIAELAAAAIADEEGRLTDAMRLRRIAHEQDPGPVTVDLAKSVAADLATDPRCFVFEWRCNKCGEEYGRRLKPEVCDDCGDTSFTRLPNRRARDDADDYRGSPDE